MRVFQLAALGSIVATAAAITPEEMIAAPRRSDAVPNPSGEVALFSTSEYSFETHATSSWWSLVDLKTGKITQLTNDSDVSEITWLGSTDSGLLYINGTNAEIPGGAEIWVSDTSDFTNSAYKAASLPAPLGGLKTAITKSGDINFLVYGESWANGTAYNEQLASTPLSTARIYDSIYVRHWDTWLTTRFNAIFSGTLNKKRVGHGAASRYASSGSLKNLVTPVKNLESPYPPFGDSSDYDLSANGKWVAFKSKAPELPRANHTASYIYLVPHDGSKKAVAINGPDSPGTPKGIKGDSASPSFSPDGRRIAYIQMEEDGYESDRQVPYIYTLDSKDAIRSFAKDWDRSPSQVKWTADGKNLILNTEDAGQSRLFLLPTNAGDNFKPKNFTDKGVVAAYYRLPNGEFLVSDSAAYNSRSFYTAKPGKGVTGTIFSANKVDPALKNIGPSDLDEFYYKGNFTDIHSWIVYPENFDKSKSYPLMFLIHGGPQVSWVNSWSTRWNFKTFADQGYVVIAPNPTGSSGFGFELQNAIQNNWGSYPYDDLVKAWEYVRDNFDFIDTDRGVAAGASYGGFMVNWIQGHPLGREFKAMASHDGTFVADAKISTEELWFMEHDFNGTIWDNRDNYRRFDPSAPELIKQFATPQLVIHNDEDYRLAVSEGLALFNVLQERGVPSRLLNFPNENHWVLNKENSLVWHQQVLGWLNKYSGVDNEGAVSLDDTTVPVKQRATEKANKLLALASSKTKTPKTEPSETESSAKIQVPNIKAEVSSPSAPAATGENETYLHTQEMGLYSVSPTVYRKSCPIFVSRNGLWDCYYISSNNIPTDTPTTPTPSTTNGTTKKTKIPTPILPMALRSPPEIGSGNTEFSPEVKMEDIPEASPNIARPSNPISSILRPNNLDRFFTSVGPFGTEDESSDASLLESMAEQARTVKHVKFFMGDSHDKHFIPVEVVTLTGHENYAVWFAGMTLLLRQHSVWPLTVGDLKPLAPSHPLYMWYERMLDCAVSLIYANVSNEIRKSRCFLHSVATNDPDELMAHIWVHYGGPDGDDVSPAESEESGESELD
ncbi:Dipeptidyl-peptidase 5 [Penicillium paradoxum]|uniref:Dipeptidyl-peptidase 5 n=1 Tax=Penicillium paradoxum TaxID=176176 RepID=UPI002548C1F4|nr:Dipeptidyl-peptidase 5 [Penicillium paradoxum]KAJ5787987.1 Dipeptidyl-peptidase 5 [Penicillium paradoxum]